MIRTILLILFLATSTSAQVVKIWQANVQHGAGTDDVTNYSRQATILTGSSADIVFMQERTTSDTGWNTPMSSGGFTEAIYRENDPSQGDGPSIWTRTSTVNVLNVYEHDLSQGAIGWDGSTNVDKAAVGIKATIRGKTVYYFNTHLAWSAGADCNGCTKSAIRVAQINELLSWISGIVGSDPNVIIGGDMNFAPDYPKDPSGLQIDLFTNAGYVSMRPTANGMGTFTVPWGDRNSDSITDNSTTSPVTHDTREIDYFFIKTSANLIRTSALTIPDLRATCPHGLVAGGVMPSCSPEVVGGPNTSGQQWDNEGDFGVRPSDHNWLLGTFSLTPVANISLPSTAFVGETIVADGCNSTSVNGQNGCSTATFTNSSSPVLWDFGDGAGTYSNAKLLRAAHIYFSAGTYSVSLTVKDSDGNSHTVSQNITISDIPTGNIVTALEQGSGSANATYVQGLINTAFANNTSTEQEIRLPNTMQITGQLTIPAAAGNKYVTIRPVSLASLPTITERINPATHAASMPKISSPGIDQIPLTIASATNKKYLRIIGIEFNKQAGHLYQFMEIGSGLTAYDQIPNHIIIDRCYFKGNPTDNTARAIFVNADTFSIINSYISEMHDDGADAQAVAGFAGSSIGIVNNYLNGLGENILFGGADAGIKFQTTASSTTSTSATLASVASLNVGDGISFSVSSTRGPWSATIVRSIIGSNITFDQVTNSSGTPTAPDTTSNTVKYGASPHDILVARNYIFKSLTQRVSDPSYNGSYAPVVKNSFELKHAQRVVVDGNFIENNWGGQGQSGPTVLFTPRNQTCYSSCTSQNNPWTMVRDVQFTNNRLKNIVSFVNILGTDDLNTSGTGESGPSAFVQYLLIENNLIERVDPFGLTNPADGTGGELIFIFPVARHITVNHNTQINLSGNRIGSSTATPTGTASVDVKFMNNIVMHRTYGFIGDGNLANDFVNTFWPDGYITYNVISDDIGGKAANGGTWTAPKTAPDYFPATIDTNTFIDRSAGNYRLNSSSPYKAGNATPAADGLDIGINYDTVLNSTANTISGVWTLTAVKRCNWHTNPACNQ